MFTSLQTVSKFLLSLFLCFFFLFKSVCMCVCVHACEHTHVHVWFLRAEEDVNYIAGFKICPNSL